MSLVFIVAGCLVFFLGRNRDLILPTNEKDSGFCAVDIPAVGENYPVFSSFIYSLEMFVPLVNLGMGDKWRPYANRTTDIRFAKVKIVVTGKWLGWYLWLHVLAGWVFTTLCSNRLKG